MKFGSTLLVGALYAAAMVSNAAADHCAQEWGQCGKPDGSLTCCPNGYYCQPWDSGNIQCQKTPDQCEKFETNIDFYGNDIETVYGLQPGACCTKCAETKGCTAFTFINHRAGPPACYLKRLGGTDKKKLIGAVSGYVKGGKKLAHAFLKQQKAGGCPTAEWGKCGDSKGSGCCPGSQYCQPWNPGFYQCIKTPPACPTQHTDIDLEGNDIGKAQAGNGDECCNACSKNPKCKAYTFVNFNNDGPQCYLKSAAGKKIRKVGAVSGVRN